MARERRGEGVDVGLGSRLRHRRNALAATLLASCLCPAALAQTVDQEGDRTPGIPGTSIAVNFPKDFGDPAGVRSALAGRGVTYAVNYIGDVLGNPVGGIEQGTRYIGRLDLELTVDMEKAIGWKGLTFFTNGYQIHGQSLSALNLGALMPASFIEAVPSTRLFEIYLEQKLLDDHLSFRFGQLSADSEFVISVLEVSYTALIVQGLTLQPDFQYFWNPGGHTSNPNNPTEATPNAAVFALRTTINY
jgi:carbohydrate-selective porin OprB